MQRPNKFETTVLTWADTTFPDMTPRSLLAHVREEIDELERACRDDDPDEIAAEAGDIGLMLIHLLGDLGISLDAAIKTKFETASKRKYEYVESLGYKKHVD